MHMKIIHKVIHENMINDNPWVGDFRYNKMLRAAEFTSFGCTDLCLVNYFRLFLTVPEEQLGKVAQSTSPPRRQLPQTHSPLSFLLLVPWPILIAFLSPRSVDKKQDSKSRPTSQRTKARGQLWTLDGFTPPPSTSGEPTSALRVQLLNFTLPGRRALNRHQTGRFMLIMDQN